MPNELVEYVSKHDAQLHRKKKTVIIEQAIGAVIGTKGHVTAALLLDAAMKKGHPLHDFFEWDDSEAARKWRLAQAEAMIIGTRYIAYLREDDGKRKKGISAIDESGKKIAVRRYLPAQGAEGFRERVEVLGDEESRRAIVERKLGALRSWCQSVVDIEELAAIRRAIEELAG